MKKIFLLTLFLLLLCHDCLAQNWQKVFVQALHNGGAYVVDHDGKVLFSHRSDEKFVPASTIKVATVAMALDTFGANHRFETEFYLLKSGELGVRGLGDPSLTSEELQLIAKKIAGLKKQFSGIVLDASYFETGLQVDGSSTSLNPYDAIPGALVANFNTIAVRKLKGGVVASGEAQTPLTALGREVGARSKLAAERINLGKDQKLCVRYFAELLIEFLKREKVVISDKISQKKIKNGEKLIYKHLSSKTLADVSRDLLKYSTNFLANQLFVLSGAKIYGAPGNMEKGKKALNAFLHNKVGWKNFVVIEGAGLSRQTKVSPAQMVQLLDYFWPYRNLLASEKPYLHAKTGSLTGVNTLIGYMKLASGKDVMFSILVNDQVAHNYKYTLAEKLYQNLR
jgi:D-alanyl-D-alanine carboxypeptidase/D-alanyl-D-alanine-endopeptidase (penicillin-binding protein 4)